MNFKRTGLLLFKLTVSAGTLWYLLTRVNTSDLLQTLKKVNPLLFILAFLLYLSTFIFSTKRWSLFISSPQDPSDNIPFRRLLSLYFIGAFFSTFLPGIVGGDAVKGYYLYKSNGRGGAVLASIFMDRYLGFSALMLTGLFAYLVGMPYIKDTIIIWLMPLLISLFIAGSIFVWFLPWGRRLSILSSFYNEMLTHRNNRKKLLIGLSYSFIVQITGIIIIYIISIGLSMKVSLLYFFIFLPIIATVSMLPVSISGLGVREGGFVLLFGLIGVPSHEALGLSLLWFLIFILSGLIGLFEYLRVKTV
jgi:uncharacterized membrane protein YbhN (UPF0104 family)